MMKRQVKKMAQLFHPKKVLIAMLVIVAGAAITGFGFDDRIIASDSRNAGIVNKDSIESVRAFAQVYKVLMSPRCMNCHPAGDIPLQGDDSHLHTMFPKRGADGKGIYAMKCANCHQPANTPGLHTPPGNPNWHLPPSDMKMVFQGKTPNRLARQLIDPNQNGRKNKKQLLEHAEDGLVKEGWNMGEGRKPPPLTYDEFVKAWRTWIEKGAYAPKS